MAILSTSDLVGMRQGCAPATIDYTKAQANAALQAIEDWYELNRAAIATAINAATAPFVFTAAQKKELGRAWLLNKYQRGN